MIRPNKRGRVPTASEVAAAARRADHHLRARYHAQVLEAVATCATAVQLGTLRGLVEVAVPLREFAPELLRCPRPDRAAGNAWRCGGGPRGGKWRIYEPTDPDRADAAARERRHAAHFHAAPHPR